MHREKFHFPDKHYFLSHSVGAQPKSYEAALQAGFITPWQTDGFSVWDPWFASIDRFRNGLGALLGAHAKDICPLQNVSSGISKVLFSLPERARRKKIVLTEDDFPTAGFALAQARRMGYELVFLPGGENLADPDYWAPAFHDDVQLVFATHAYSNSSVLAPCAEIAHRARERGVFSMLDIAQSAGAIPIHLNNWGADFAVGTSLKYLCGGPGAAFLWAHEDTAGRCAPLDVGWFSHSAPFEFDIHNFNYADGAARYTGGTPSIAPLAGACAGLDILGEIGVEKIYAHNQALLDQLTESLGKDVLASTTRNGARGSGALIKVDDYEKAAAALSEAGIVHDTRLGAVRVSVHFYNDEGDIGALADAIRPCL